MKARRVRADNTDVVRRFAPGELTRAEAVRFLQRTTFGGTVTDVDHLITVGSDAWFAEQFAADLGPAHLDARANDVRLSTSVWGRYLSSPAQLRARYAAALSQIFVVSDHDVNENRVARFADLLEAGCFGTYRALLEAITRSTAMGFYLTYNGNRRADARRGSVPDENYAREIMQLFSIGLWELHPDGTRRTDAVGHPIPAYDQDDILGLARVFTGFQAPPILDDFERYALAMPSDSEFSQTTHEQGEKRFLGVVIPESESNTLDESLAIALDTLAEHPNTGPFICRQLIQRLVTSNPSPGYVGRVAAVFADDGSSVRGNLAAVLEAIVLDDEAWSSTPDETFGKLREPVLRFTTIARALGVTSTAPVWAIASLADEASELGQQPFESPSVFNFYRPGYVPPQTAIGEAGLVAPEMQIANETTAIGWVNYVATFLRRPPGRTVTGPDGGALRVETAFDVDDLLAIVSVKDLDVVRAGQLVDEIAARLCPDGLGPDVRDVVMRRTRSIFDDRYDPDRTESYIIRIRDDIHMDRVMAAVMMIAVSTDFLYERRTR